MTFREGQNRRRLTLVQAAEKVETADPSRPKPARDDKNEGLSGTAEGVPFQIASARGVFQQPLKARLWNRSSLFCQLQFNLLRRRIQLGNSKAANLSRMNGFRLGRAAGSAALPARRQHGTKR